MKAHDRLCDVMSSAMQLQPLINLVSCPARLSPARSVAIVSGSCSVCRSDLSTMIALQQGVVSNALWRSAASGRISSLWVLAASGSVAMTCVPGAPTYSERTDASQGSDRR